MIVILQTWWWIAPQPSAAPLAGSKKPLPTPLLIGEGNHEVVGEVKKSQPHEAVSFFIIYEIFNYIPQGQLVFPNFLRNSELSTKFSSKYFLP